MDKKFIRIKIYSDKKFIRMKNDSIKKINESERLK